MFTTEAQRAQSLYECRLSKGGFLSFLILCDLCASVVNLSFEFDRMMVD